MLPLALLAVCACAALSAPTLDPQLDQHWQLWKGWHSKNYHEVSAVPPPPAGAAPPAET